MVDSGGKPVIVTRHAINAYKERCKYKQHGDIDKIIRGIYRESSPELRPSGEVHRRSRLGNWRLVVSEDDKRVVVMTMYEVPTHYGRACKPRRRRW